MKKYVVVPAAVVLFIFVSWTCVLANDIVWDDIGRGNVNFKAVFVNPDKPQIIYAGSGNAVLKSEDGGSSWRSILSVRGQSQAVNLLLFDPQDENSLYAATGNGLFFSANQGKSWSRVFKGKNALENECTSLAALPAALYLGTKAGLFFSNDRGRTWHKEIGGIGKASVLNIAYNPREPNCIYVACIAGVFKTEDSGKSWERIFITHSAENGDEKDQAEEDRDEEEQFSDIRYISIVPDSPGQLYVASRNGVLISRDKGKNWEAMTDYGLLNREIKFLLISSKSDIYAVGKSGIFKYGNGRWHELTLGLTSNEVRFLAQDKDNLYAACESGLFKANLKDFFAGAKGNPISFYFQDEPGIEEIQQAAIRYAEVESEKIKQWRRQAAKKALLPQLSIGIDRNTTDLWHWEGGSTTKLNDDILRRGRDSVDWDVSLSWDLGELVWNDDQTSIDVRSRLLVQLRDDILDEVTKLYFERLRVKMELDNLSLEDRKKRFEKELKIRELSAMLDALTGGYFSRHLKTHFR